jgi:hypothetical protein
LSSLTSVWTIDIIVGTISVLLMSWIALFYARTARRLKTPFTIGLMVLAFVFLLQSLISVIVYLSLAQTYSADVAVPMLLLGALNLSGFATLFWISKQ